MPSRPFCNSGLQVPAHGFGAMQIGDPRSGRSDAVQAAVNVCDQQSWALLPQAQVRAIGTIAQRSLAGGPWIGTFSANLDELALRFAAFAPGVDPVIVGGIDATNVDRNVAAACKGALEAAQTAALENVYEAHGTDWRGLV